MTAHQTKEVSAIMKWTKKLLILASILTLCLGFTLTTQAADRQFKKKTVVIKEGKSKVLTLVNSDSLPEVAYYDKDTSLFSYTVQGNSKIKVTARRAGIDYLTVPSGDAYESCCLVILPKKNPELKSRETKKGKTVISYKKIRLTLPPAWKKYGYIILTGDDYISFCSKSNYRSGYYGNLFTIEWCSGSEYANRVSYLPAFQYLKRVGPTVYYITFPTDVRFNTENAKYQKHYHALQKTINTIIKSFRAK